MRTGLAIALLAGLAVGVVVAVIELSEPDEVADDVRPTPDEPCLLTTARDLGPATRSAALATGELVGDDLLVVTRDGTEGPVVARFDLRTERVTETLHLDEGRGAWASTVAGDGALYVGTYLPARLYRVDLEDGMSAAEVTAFTDAAPDTEFIHTLATDPDGDVVIGSYPDAGVRVHLPGSDEVTTLAENVADQVYVRSLAATETHVYAGTGPAARLVAIDRETGEQEDVLPDELRDETVLYTLVADGDGRLLAGTEPRGHLAVIDTDDHTVVAVHRIDDARTIDAFHIEDGVGYATSRMAGIVHRLPLDGTSPPTRVAQPVEGEETRALFGHDDGLVGVGGSGTVWRVDPETGAARAVDLTEAGLPPQSEIVQTLAWLPDGAYVGGHWGVEIHDLDEGTSRRVRMAGEPKAMIDADGILHAALYPGGDIWRYDPATDEGAARVTVLDERQIRPRAAHHDAAGGRVLVGTQPEYGAYGGSLSVVDLETGHVTTDDTIVGDHAVRTVTSVGRVAIVGSEDRGGTGTQRLDEDVILVAVDLDTGEQLWTSTPVPGARSINDLVASGDHVHAVTDTGHVLTVRVSDGELVRARDLGRGRGGNGIVEIDRILYTVAGGDVVGLDPTTLETRVEIEGDGYGFLVGRGTCGLVATHGRDLHHLTP